MYNYRCNAATVRKICTFTGTISEKKIEKQLLDNLGQYIGNEVIKIESIEEAQQTKANTAKIEKIKTEMDRLNMMFRKGRIEEEEYDTEYMKLEKKLGAIDIVEEPPKRDLDALKGLLETDYRGLYNQLTKENKKAFWRRIIKEFALDEQKRIDPDSIIFF